MIGKAIVFFHSPGSASGQMKDYLEDGQWRANWHADYRHWWPLASPHGADGSLYVHLAVPSHLDVVHEMPKYE